MSDIREALVSHLERVGVGYGLHDGLKREVLGAWADAILAAGWTPPRSVAELVTGAAHPEDVCHRCGGPNVVRWHAPSEAWSQVEQHEGILCPQCFTSAYEALYPGTAWHVGPEVGGPCRYPLLTNEEPSALPSVEDVARVLCNHQHDVTSYDAWDLHGCDCGWEVPGPRPDDAWGHYRAHLADVILALLPGRTETEVKAEALREAASVFTNADVLTTEEQREFAAWLMVRANNIEKEADRG